jgi:hypothetical protein
LPERLGQPDRRRDRDVERAGAFDLGDADAGVGAGVDFGRGAAASEPKSKVSSVRSGLWQPNVRKGWKEDIPTADIF